ncbi:MAG: HlyD family efflux transporter periplasmic adaptor subunit [bacterium]
MAKRIPTLPILLALSLAVLAGCGSSKKGPNPSGTLEATEVDLAGTWPGKVLEVRVREGDHVKRGDSLVVIDTDLLRLQRRQSEAALQSLDAQLGAAQDMAKQAQQNSRLASVTAERTALLYQQGSATQQQVDETSTRKGVASSQLAAAQKQVTALRAESSRLLASLALLDRQIQDGILASPLDGTVLLRSVEPGEVLGVGATALRLANLSHLELRVFLDVNDVDRISLGQEVTVLVDALEGEKLTGRVSWISSEAEFTPKNVQTRNARSQLVYAVKVDVDNPDGRLSIGMPAEMVLP